MRIVAKKAFDKLYKAYGGDLSEWISTYLTAGGPKTSRKPYKQFGTRWMYNNVHILLEVENTADYDLVKTEYYPDTYYAKSAFPNSTFYLINQFAKDGKEHHQTNEALYELLEETAKAKKVGSFFEIGDKDTLDITGKISRGTSKAGKKVAKTRTIGIDPKDLKEIPLNLILYGPPGTGKTYNAIFKTLDIMGIRPKDTKGTFTTKATWFDNEEADRDLALKEFNALKSDGRIEFMTFHQSMSYEDFIEGIKPDLAGKAVDYTIEPGLFKQISIEASKPENEQKRFVLIIDEINRGNIANIFGELITLIEDDKRTTKWDKTKGTYVDNPEAIRVKLPYSKDKEPEFGVPGNLYIIGTMNTADRSVEALDSALRRRFSFEEMMPKPNLLASVTIDGLGKTLEDLLSTINERIEVLKDREHQIGHSYFMGFVAKGKKHTTVKPEELKSVFTDKIIPLLQEYFYGDYEKIRLVVGDVFVKPETVKIEFAGKVSVDDLPEKKYSIEKNPDMTEALKKLLNIKAE